MNVYVSMYISAVYLLIRKYTAEWLFRYIYRDPFADHFVDSIGDPFFQCLDFLFHISQ